MPDEVEVVHVCAAVLEAQRKTPQAVTSKVVLIPLPCFPSLEDMSSSSFFACDK